SSALTAIHEACESLRAGDCRMAIAGGVSLLYPELYQLSTQIGMVASQTGSRSLTEGDGVLVGEGVGAVLLKPLSDAILAGDNIRAVIRSSLVTHSGQSNINASNTNAKSLLFENTLNKAGIDPRSIGCVETAAYGSPLNDAVEIS